jgi:cell division transport system ATP-binding protein
LKIFEKINNNGVTVLIATHDNNLIKMFSKKTIELKQGKLVSYPSMEEQQWIY